MKPETRVALANLWEDLYKKYDKHIEEFRREEIDLKELVQRNGRDYTDYLNAKGIIVGIDGDFTQDGALSGQE